VRLAQNHVDIFNKI